MITKIIAPTNNVNDTSVVVYELLVENDSSVKSGQAVLIVETSKATLTIESPADGFIHFMTKIGDEVLNGNVLAVVGDTVEEAKDFGSNGDNANPDKTAKPLLTKETHKTPDAPDSEENKAGKDENNGISFGIFDHSVTLGEIMFKNGDAVTEGEAICKVRHADKVETVKSPASDFISWNKKPYETIKAGEAIGEITKQAIKTDKVKKPAGTSKPVATFLRLSKAAQQFLDERGLTAEVLGLSGLVTVQSVQSALQASTQSQPSNDSVNEPRINQGQTKSRQTKPSVSNIGNVVGHYQKLSKAKRAEGDFLARANKDAVVSQVSVLVPTQRIFTACADDPELARKFSSIIILEVSRLLKSFPAINAVHADHTDHEADNGSANGQLYLYDSINVGYALSIDDGLKVPVFKNADTKDLETIMAEKDRFIEKYINRELTPDDMAGGTFTITDLSSSGCYFFNPVLNLGQSAILGIGGEDTEHMHYHLILAFDHRVVDGAMATEFLCRLRDRLVAHERVLIHFSIESAATENIKVHKTPVVDTANTVANMIDLENLACDSCFRTAEELEEDGHYLFKVIDKHGQEKHICSICMRGW